MAQTIILVKYVDDYIWVDKDGKYNTQVCGYKDNTPMMLEVWRIPHETKEKAEKLRDDVSKAGIIIFDKKLRTLGAYGAAHRSNLLRRK